MPTLPPWLRPAQPAPLYAQGMALGLRAAEQQASAAMQQQRLAAEMEQQEQRAQLAREQMEIERQRSAVEQERYRQAFELDRAEQSRKADLATRQREAQVQYQTRVKAGEDPLNVLSEMWPLLGGAGPEAALIRAQQQQAIKTAQAPQPFELPGGVRGVWNPQSGAFQLLRDPAEITQYQRQTLIDRMQKQSDALLAANPDLVMTEPDPSWNKRRKQSWDSGRKSLMSIEERMGELASGAAVETPSAPGTKPRWRFNPATGSFEGGPTAGAAPTRRVPPGAVPEWPSQEEYGPPADEPPAPMATSIQPTNWMNPRVIGGGRY